MKYTTVFIDLDDTLIDTIANTIETLQEIYSTYDLGKYFETFDNFKTIYQANNTNSWKLYEQNQITKADLNRKRFTVPFANIEDIDEAKALEINEDYLARIVQKDTLIDGAIELLDYLHPKYKIHIISNGFTEMQFKKIESVGLGKYFDKVILSDVVGVNKPHPDIFSYALTEAGITSTEAIMIGDNYVSDITGAYNSGIDQIWYNPHNKGYVDFEPTYTIQHLSDIIDIL